MPIYNLPSKILCKVVNIVLKVHYNLSLEFSSANILFTLFRSLIFNDGKLKWIEIFGKIYRLINFLFTWTIHLVLQAEAHTDEVFAQITLAPLIEVSFL